MQINNYTKTNLTEINEEGITNHLKKLVKKEPGSSIQKIAAERILEAYQNKIPTLDLSNLGLSSLPTSVGLLTHLTCLCLSGNKLNQIPSEIQRLTNLQILYLSNNKLTTLKIDNLNLTQLFLSYNKLENAPSSIGKLINLEILDLSGNQLTSLEKICKLNNLRIIDLSHNPVASLPLEINQLKELEIVVLSKNQFLHREESGLVLQKRKERFNFKIDENTEFVKEIHLSLEKWLANPQVTDSMKIAADRIQNTAYSLAEELNLSDLNDLDSLPDCLALIVNLKYIKLNQSQAKTMKCNCPSNMVPHKMYIDTDEINMEAKALLIDKLDEWLNDEDRGGEKESAYNAILQAACSQSENLDLSSLNLNNLPDFSDYLQSLQELNLSDNNITSIPDWINQLKNLKNLDFSDNLLETIPDCIGELKNLHILYLDQNSLREIPDCIGELKNLEQICLSENAISHIPDCIGRLENLQTLYFSDNQLTEIPDCIGRLENLQALYFSNNHLTEIPSTMLNLLKLELLDLSNNLKITKLPLGFEKLVQINLQGRILDITYTNTGIPPNWQEINQLEIRNLKTKRVIQN